MKRKNDLTDKVYLTRCPACRQGHFVSKRKRHVNVGKDVDYIDEVYYCYFADAEFITDELATSNLARLRKAIKEGKKDND